MTSDESWSTACGIVLTSTTAADADKAACRELMKHRDSDFGWPEAFMVAAIFLAVAWGVPRILKGGHVTSPFDPGVVLTVWVIYHGARNHPPGVWVVRAHDALTDTTVRFHELLIECGSLDEARSMLPEGLYRCDRAPSDDPAIVETWI